MSIVRCENLSRIYNQGQIEVRALDGVNLRITAGEFVSVAGPSGSGKSTLLNLIGALDQPTQGKIWIGEELLNGLNKTQLADLRLRRIGFVFQSYNLVPVLSAVENVEFVLQLQGVAAKQRRDRAQQMLRRVGLKGLENRRPAELSGGQQQRVAVARAIASHPDLLLADEPSANLDSKTTTELMELLSELNATLDTTIVMVTHDPAVMRFAKRQIQMLDGRILEDDALVDTNSN
jgi:putative ABC transport system ATP-binding protein